MATRNTTIFKVFLCFLTGALIGCGVKAPHQPPVEVVPQVLSRGATPKPNLVSGTSIRKLGPPVAPRIFTASELFPPLAVGQCWTYENARGGHMTTCISDRPTSASCATGEIVALTSTKDTAAGYWAEGVPEASTTGFIVNLGPDRGWQAYGEMPKFPLGCPWCQGHTLETINWDHSGQPNLHWAPPTIAEGEIIHTHASAHTWQYLDSNVSRCIIGDPAAIDLGIVGWDESVYVDTVNTPIYAGPAVVIEIKEGDGRPCPIYERNFFAPGIGPVETDAIADGSVNPDGSCHQGDPALFNKRIN